MDHLSEPHVLSYFELNDSNLMFHISGWNVATKAITKWEIQLVPWLDTRKRIWVLLMVFHAGLWPNTVALIVSGVVAYYRAEGPQEIPVCCQRNAWLCLGRRGHILFVMVLVVDECAQQGRRWRWKNLAKLDFIQSWTDVFQVGCSKISVKRVWGPAQMNHTLKI